MALVWMKVGGDLFRPLLHDEERDFRFSRRARDSLCFDHTNDEAIYTRNKVRLTSAGSKAMAKCA